MATIITSPGGSIISIKQFAGQFEYDIDNTGWNFLSFPCTINNSNPSSGLLKVYFTTDITLFNPNNYFICGSDNIQFGNASLNDDGTRQTITIDTANYEGLIRNGAETEIGKNNIYVFNLHINSIGYSNKTGAGWIGQKYFGRGGSDNYIVNCSSNGDIAINGGGIVGANAGAESGGNLTIIGCSSSGSIDSQAGGIVGNSAGQDEGIVTCQSCFSTGVIGINAGGIIGEGSSIGTITITNCYTVGLIQDSGGGICGANFGSSLGSATISNCYTTGNISSSAGGIISGLSQNTSITNCYTTGDIIGVLGGGIAGPGGSPTISHCYTTGSLTGSMGYIKGGSVLIPDFCYSEAAHDSSEWSTINANTVLQNTPSPVIGSTWVATVINQPYELINMGYTPYATQNIGFSSGIPYLKRSITLSIEKGSTSIPAIISDKGYTILEKTGGDSGSYSTITINTTTGVISTTASTQSDTYTLNIRNTGSYHMTSISLTITSSDPIPCLTEDTMVLTPNGYVNIAKLNRGDLVITNNNKKVKIVNIFRSLVAGNLKTFPCVIPRNGIGQNYPPEELKISQHHLIKYHDLWILPKQFFPLDKTEKTIKYYHIQLENYLTDHLVINNGVVVESLANPPNNIKNNVQTAKSIQNLLEYNKRCSSVTRNRTFSTTSNYF